MCCVPYSQIHVLKSYPLGQNMTMFGDGIFKEVIKLKLGH